MATYSIKDLEKISGIKAHTIRIWEQRYKLLTPNRSDTNIRSYDDDQARKLLNVATLIHSGEKISKISDLTSDQFTARLNKVTRVKLRLKKTIYQKFISSLNVPLISINSILNQY